MGYVKIRAVRVVQNITKNLAMKSNSNLNFPNKKNSGSLIEKSEKFFSFDTEIIPILYQ